MLSLEYVVDKDVGVMEVIRCYGPDLGRNADTLRLLSGTQAWEWGGQSDWQVDISAGYVSLYGYKSILRVATLFSFFNFRFLYSRLPIA